MRVEFLNEFGHHLIGDAVHVDLVHIGGLHELQQTVHFGGFDRPLTVLIDDTLCVRFLGQGRANEDTQRNRYNGQSRKNILFHTNPFVMT